MSNSEVAVPSSYRKVSVIAGLLYLLTFVSIPTLALYTHAKSASYIIGSGPDTSALIGAVLEVTIAIVGIGTAVVLFPILKKVNESAALALVAIRILESSTILVGVAFILSIVTLRQSHVGSDYLAVAHTLSILYDRIFLLGQSFMPAICDLLLGFMLYKSRLVPRGLAVIGIAGGPLLLIGYFAILFGATPQRGQLAGLSAVLVAIFEFSLGVWLLVKGFSSKAVVVLEAKK
jgi:hypothetical protein